MHTISHYDLISWIFWTCGKQRRNVAKYMYKNYVQNSQHRQTV